MDSTHAYGAVDTEGGRPLKNATPGKLAAFVVSSFVVGIIIPGLACDGQDPSKFTCTPGLENSAWCDTNPLDVAVSEAVVVAPRTVGLLSHAFTVVASPVVGIGSMVRLRGPGTLASDMAVYTGTQLVTVGLNSIAKCRARRQRPCFHFGRQNETELGLAPALMEHEQFVSFYSGDSALAFSLYSAALALIIARGWRTHALQLSKVGAVLASIGVFGRVVGFMHWFTDAMTGATAGLIVGFGLPTLLFCADTPKNALATAFRLPARGEASTDLLPTTESDGGTVP